MTSKADLKLKAESASDDVQLSDLAIDPAQERKLLWKLDLCICPLVMLIFLVAYLDRSNLGYVQPMHPDRGMKMNHI